jgi:hypothetical protein
MISGLVACNPVKLQPEHYVAIYFDQPVTTERFRVCNSPGCEQHVAVRFSADQWQQLLDLMQPPASSASEERKKVQEAVALFEQLVTPWTQTQNDKARNGWGRGAPQLDCIAETVNTTTYLMLLQQQDLLKWHEVAEPRHRGFLTFVGPHNTAVLKEKQTGKEYAIDSWFHANGMKPEVVEINHWIGGFDPDEG